MDGEIVVTIGIPFGVILRGLSSAGYAWICRDTPPGIQLVGADFAGGGLETDNENRKVFTFVATIPGRFLVDFELKRPWEPTAIEEQRITVRAFEPERT